ncbi:MAG TPA: nucleoside triphosphate pyrophosphohydrolase, partial [Desulfobacteria bacterium]|nr:nucleoside triphosphate pyrophosphohydrolase [Desulfobacteria bacterium]
MSAYMKDMDNETIGKAVGDLLSLVRRLRAPDGCPWDAKQNKHTIKIYLIEEAYEVLDAIENGSSEEICGELGDLLFQIVFLATLAEEKGEFDFAEVVKKITAKMIHRHPHVFSGTTVTSADQVAVNWAKIKRAEANGSELVSASLKAIPNGLPALLRAHRLSERAAKFGFDWTDRKEIWKKVLEEVEELKCALESDDEHAVTEETGDLLFSLVNLSRHWGTNAEDLLRSANRKFLNRFERMEKHLNQRGIPL